MKFSDPEKALIVHLRGLPVADRLAALEHASMEAPELRERIPPLLIAAEEDTRAAPEEEIGDHAVQALSAALAAAPEDASGTHVGNYKLLQKIGEGGFGVVWMAEQQQPVRRRVALKILKAGMDTDEVISRFEAERQALALMEHANIARVFEAGATEMGRPFFAMELVRGVAITRFCDENRLSAEARLRLFVTVCLAVQHAHQKGVIHRDLKPSNILVTLHDGVPVPKIIDFGIAKATSGRLTEKTLFTQFHSFIGTPAYTSPEQMEMSGLDVDTRSDIYSLGVLLYELLTGQPPFDSDSLVKSGLDAMRRTIREIDPPRPSHRLGTLSDVARSTIAEQRGTEVGKLSLLLRGDLDWIAMRCLEKDRTRRYDSAASLAADIERHLSDHIVEARPPSGIYQAKKFVRRHKLGVGAAAAVAVTLIAGIIASSSLFVRERSALSRAVSAEQKERELRRQAEVARSEEIKRAARTALDLANRNLDEGRVAEGLAYLVHTARKDPRNSTLGSRFASILAAHVFFLPEGPAIDGGSRILSTHYSLDGHTFFVGSVDGTLRSFDTVSGNPIREYKLGKPVKLFGGWQFASASDRMFAAYFADNSFGVFDAVTGRPIGPPLPLDPTLVNDASAPDRAGLSPDGRGIYLRRSAGFRLWDAVTGESLLDFTDAGVIWDHAFSADGRRLAVAYGEAVQIWSLPECRRIGEPIPIINKGRIAPHLAVRFSPDGSQLAVCQSLAGFHLFDLTTGAQLRPMLPFEEYLPRLGWDFAPDGRLLVIGGKSARFWDLKTGDFTALPFAASGYFEQHNFSEDGRRLLVKSSDGFARIWDSQTGTIAAEVDLGQQLDFQACLSPDGKRLVVGTVKGTLRRFHAVGGPAQPLVLPRPLPAMPAGFMPGPVARLLWLGSESARVLDVASGREIGGGFTFPRATGQIDSAYVRPPFRPDLKFLIARTNSGGWEAWELDATGVRQVVPLRGEPDEKSSIIFSPVGDRVATIGLTTIHVWDLRTGAKVGPGIDCGRMLAKGSVNFSPDGRLLGIGCSGGLAALWTIETGRQTVTFGPLQDVPIQAVTFSPDGSRVVTADRAGEARVWDAITGTPVGPVLFHPEVCLGAHFSPDGRAVTTVSLSGLFRWDATTGAPLGRPLLITDLRGSPTTADQRRLLAVADAGETQLWDIETSQPLTEPIQPGARLAGGKLSPDERFALIEVLSKEPSFHLWALPPVLPAEAAVPEWLLQLATLCSQKTVNDAGELVALADEPAKFDVLRRDLASLPADAPLAEWGRWILDDRADRSIAPGFHLTAGEAEKIASTLRSPVNGKP